MNVKIKRIIVDIDNTITIHNSSKEYPDKLPNLPLIQMLKEYQKKGYEIILFSARNMKTYNGDISKINVNTLPILIEWLRNNEVPYDGIIMGKPWCGDGGFYIDDKAIRPSEFIELTEDEIINIIN